MATLRPLQPAARLVERFAVVLNGFARIGHAFDRALGHGFEILDLALQRFAKACRFFGHLRGCAGQVFFVGFKITGEFLAQAQNLHLVMTEAAKRFPGKKFWHPELKQDSQTA